MIEPPSDRPPATAPAGSLAGSSAGELRHAAGWLAWLALGLVTWWIVDGFLAATLGPSPRFLRPEPPRTSTLWGSELGIEPGVARRLEVSLRGAAVLHLIGRPAAPGPLRLLRISTSPRLPSGVFRVDPGEPALHRPRLQTPEEASTTPGDGERGDRLDVDLDALGARFPEVARWSFFTLGDSTDSGRRVAVAVAGDRLGTRTLAAAWVAAVIGVGLALGQRRGREGARGARALRWAACLPPIAAALIVAEPAGVTVRLVVLAVALVGSAVLAFGGRGAATRWAAWWVAALAALPIAWAVARLATGRDAATAAVVIEGAAAPEAEPAAPIGILVVGERGAPFVEGQPPPIHYPARLVELWREVDSARALRIVDARASLDPFRDPGAWAGILARERPDVAIVELRPADPGPQWLPSALGRPIAAALAPPSRRRASPAELDRVLEAARRAGARPLVLVRPDPAAYLACGAILGERCAEVSRRALAALDSFDWVIDLNPPLQAGIRRLVPPFRDAAGELNAWGEELAAREVRDQLELAYRRAPRGFP